MFDRYHQNSHAISGATGMNGLTGQELQLSVQYSPLNCLIVTKLQCVLDHMYTPDVKGLMTSRAYPVHNITILTLVLVVADLDNKNTQ